jgi:hypothetical protein
MLSKEEKIKLLEQVKDLQKLTGKKVVLKEAPVQDKLSHLMNLLREASGLAYDIARENPGQGALDFTKQQVKNELTELWANLYSKVLGEAKK